MSQGDQNYNDQSRPRGAFRAAKARTWELALAEMQGALDALAAEIQVGHSVWGEAYQEGQSDMAQSFNEALKRLRARGPLPDA